MKIEKSFDGNILKVKENSKYTPTPWKVQKARSLYASVDSWTIETENGKNTPVSAILKEADAAFIVRAVNSHEELLELVKNYHETQLNHYSRKEKGCKVCEAIAKAEGK